MTSPGPAARVPHPAVAPDKPRPGGAGPEPAAPGSGDAAAEPAGGSRPSSVPDVPADGAAVRLPEPVRLLVVARAADALSWLPTEDVPAALRAVARFTPGKRAKLAGTALAAALETDEAFRSAVAGWIGQTALPAAADPVELAAAAYLLRAPDWTGYVERARTALDEVAEQSRAREKDSALTRLRTELATARAVNADELHRLQASLDAVRAEADALRKQLREQTGQRRAAERARTAAVEELAADRRRAAAAESVAGAEVRRLRQKLAEAGDVVESARRAAREARQADEARLWLLLDTVSGAVQGLRRELALTPTDERPADAVRGITPTPDRAAARGDDPGWLDRLLELPRVHLIVDGYNVTKTGYGDLPLAAQRTRLVKGLAALAARTGAEISCVFDGAARPPVAPPAPRGLRVLFSAPGELADDLIRRLVAAEPGGRPVVVVSADREVAESTRAAGGYPVPSVVLLRRLDRG
jgi:predicted RNA-binding protein with PIN domain